MASMVEVIIESIRVSLTNQQRVVVLRQTDSEYYLPIWIGPYEAEAITIALQNIEVSRPQTHDLLMSVITRMGGRLRRVEVVALREDVFYGVLVVETPDATLEIDSRPSDALALAVRARVPILVAAEVMKTAGVVPDKEITSESQEPAAEHEGAPEAESRLSVFEDFLSNLNVDDDLPPADEDEDDEEDQQGSEPEA